MAHPVWPSSTWLVPKTNVRFCKQECFKALKAMSIVDLQKLALPKRRPVWCPCPCT
ncbi:uncharacterized protein B0H18DRAFT_981717 [Fomitopsis serialis]|uniref:uncharacterized protein n=1 Tax=Fomitopsis serialis TaxID=139415 RepID=UPI0020073B5E|nr:uncharacterized protein B0H18DRAFT_981717 [Neoantrodia serialis]KAH9933716.1 hypothetical protein B0H18DRAFT_981717 [Neoantrodia serialis]